MPGLLTCEYAVREVPLGKLLVRSNTIQAFLKQTFVPRKLTETVYVQYFSSLWIK